MPNNAGSHKLKDCQAPMSFFSSQQMAEVCQNAIKLLHQENHPIHTVTNLDSQW